jgi:pterin-4a-carbinolamine dehydratase
MSDIFSPLMARSSIFCFKFVQSPMDHHPELFNVYNRVVIDLATHDVDGISNLDIELAKKIDTL